MKYKTYNKLFKTNRQKPKKAFTLIELLVVIAIIGILASVVVVNVGSSRAKARYSKIVNDMKQIATATQLYYDDHRYYPVNRVAGTPNYNYWYYTDANHPGDFLSDAQMRNTPCGGSSSYGVLITSGEAANENATIGIVYYPPATPWYAVYGFPIHGTSSWNTDRSILSKSTKSISCKETGDPITPMTE